MIAAWVAFVLLALVPPVHAGKAKKHRKPGDTPAAAVTVSVWPPILIAGAGTWARVTVTIPPHSANRGVFLQWQIGDRGEQGLAYWDLDAGSPMQHVRYIKHVSHPGVLLVTATLVREVGGKPKAHKARATAEIKQ